MGFQRLLAAIFRRNYYRSDTAFEKIHKPHELQAVLQRERARVFRSGDVLTVATFTAPDADKTHETFALLIKHLSRRLRITDDVGWMDPATICAVFPHTDVVGAWKVVDDVCLEFPADVPPPVCYVYCHPYDENGHSHNGAHEHNGQAHRRLMPIDALFYTRMPLWKRAIDVVGSILALIVLSPLFVAIAIAVWLTSSGPIIFRQRRSGKGGRPFFMLKFRTMVADAEARKSDLMAINEVGGPAFKLSNDPRVTLIGRFLRKTSLDELPQLWNVLKGNMSLVGPRPLPCEETDACAPWHRQRLDVTPGITCIWQVSGRSNISFDAWIRMDVQYMKRVSPRQDLKLLLLTVPAVLLGRGAK